MTFTIANLNLDSGYTSKLGNLKTEDKQNLEDMVKLLNQVLEAKTIQECKDLKVELATDIEFIVRSLKGKDDEISVKEGIQDTNNTTLQTILDDIKKYQDSQKGIDIKFQENELTKADKKKLNLDTTYSKTKYLIYILFAINIVVFGVILLGVYMMVMDKKMGDKTIFKRVSGNNKKNSGLNNVNNNSSSNNNKNSNNSLSNL